jgi:iron-sulfur cluster insertion protein
MVTLSDDACVKVVELLASETPNTKLRIFVQGGGCSGFSYGFTFDDVVNDDDFEIEIKDSPYKMLVDSMSSQYLEGAVVDYVDDLNGSSFSIVNPQATSTCGCGNSFSV